MKLPYLNLTPFKKTTAAILLASGLACSSQAVNVVISGTSQSGDQSLIDFINNNFTNVTSVTYGDYSDPATIPTDTDIYMVGRKLSSTAYANATNSATFNAMTNPVVCFTSYVARDLGGRWGWHSGSADGNFDQTNMTVTAAGATVLGLTAGSGYTFYSNAGSEYGVSQDGASVGGGSVLVTVPLVAGGNGILAAGWTAGQTNAIGQTFGGNRLLWNVFENPTLAPDTVKGRLALVRALEFYTPLRALAVSYSTFPADGTTLVPVNSDIVVTATDIGGELQSLMTNYDMLVNGSSVTGVSVHSTNGVTTFTYNPPSNLAHDTTYSVELDVKRNDGVTDTVNFSFTTIADNTMHVLLSGTSQSDDQPVIDFLTNNFKNVIVTYGDYSDYSAHAAEIQAAKVFMVARSLSSTAYANAANSASFNALTNPVVNFTSYVTRTNSGRWGWHDGDVVATNTVTGSEAAVTAAGASIFGVTEGLYDWYSGADAIDAEGQGAVGEGQVLATVGNGILAAGWNAGQTNGTGVAFGGNRLLFNLSQDHGNHSTVIPDTDAGQQALISAITNYTPLGQLVRTNLCWAAGDGTWDIGSSATWTYNGATTTYQDGDRVNFNDTASGTPRITVTLDSTVTPYSFTATNNTKDYIISGSGSIAGSESITKAGSGTLTLDTYNSSFTGPVNLDEGTIVLGAGNGNGGVLGASDSLNLNGGTLCWASGSSEDISSQPVAPYFPRTVIINGTTVLDTGANNVSLFGAIGSGGSGALIKGGAGTLTLGSYGGDNRYYGNTVVSNGVLALGGGASISNSPAIIVNSGATFDASANGGLTLAGSPAKTLAGAGTFNGTIISSNGVITPGTNGVVGTLTFANDLTVAGGSLSMDVSPNPGPSDLIMVGGSLSLNGGTVQLNVTGTLANGTYKLIQYAGSLLSGSGSSGALVLKGFSQAGQTSFLDDSTTGEIDLVVIANASDNLTWGDGSNGSTWDLAGTLDWLNGSTPWAFTNGSSVTFNDSGTPTVNLETALNPGSVMVNNSSQDYTFADGTGVGGGKLLGSSGITKSGTGKLIIATANANSGPTVINGGTVQVGNGGALGDLGTGNVTNNGALVFNQIGSHLVAGSLSGTGSVTQEGSGTVTLAGDNSYAGSTTISSGTLQIGNGGATGSLGTSAGSVTDNGGLVFNRTGTLTIANQIVGSGSLIISGGGEFTLSGANSYAGGTTINGGKVIMASATALGTVANLDVESGGTNDLNGHDLTVTGLNSATSGGLIVNNGGSATNVLTLDVSGTADSAAAILDNEGAGGKIALVKTGAGTQTLRGVSSYSGGTTVSAGTLILSNVMAAGTGPIHLQDGSTLSPGNGVTTGNLSTAYKNPITIDGNVTFAPTVSYPSINGPITGSGTLTMNLGANVFAFGDTNAGQFAGFSGTIQLIASSGGGLKLRNDGGARNDKDFSHVTLDLGNGAGGRLYNSANNPSNINSGNVTQTVGALKGGVSTFVSGTDYTPGGNFTYNVGSLNADAEFDGLIENGFAPGVVSIIKSGTGKWTLSNTNTYTGSTTINDGTLALVNGVNGDGSIDYSRTITLAASSAVLDVSGRSDGMLNLGNVAGQTLSGIGTINGSLNEAANSTVRIGLGTLNVTNAATLNGALIMQLNRTNAFNASKLTAGSLVNASALTVTNVGPELQGGDTFQLFSGAVTGFIVTNLPALPGGMYWTNNLAVDGSIAVISTINTNPPPILSSYSGGVLTLSWPTNAGWTLQMQTNNLATGLGTNWVNVPGSDSITTTNITVDPSAPTVFYRLKNP